MSAGPVATALARELGEQSRWKPRPAFAGTRLFTDLVHEEFLSPADKAERRRADLARILRHAGGEVPYWASLFERLGDAPTAFAGEQGLSRLPVLTRDTVRQQVEALHARSLPRGETLAQSTYTTGSTGQPLRVAQTARSAGAFGVLRQRAMRWFRFDPRRVLAVIQPGRDLPQTAGRQIGEGNRLRRDHWFTVGHLFETGPCAGMDHASAIEDQLSFLADLDPAYALVQAGHLEQLALAVRAHGTKVALDGLYGNSVTLTDEMRRIIEDALGAPVHMAYGLNEFGIVAATCAEGGRYHVNDEHCVIEIVDADGRRCRPGETGRLLVSGLVNTAMPLLRYDTGDLAEAVDGPCACGRTLTSFGGLQGRYRRWTKVPAETFVHWKAVAIAMEELPEEVLTPLVRYQLYQRLDRTCELRLITRGELSPQFEQRMRERWQAADVECGVAAPLEFRVGVQPFVAPGGKMENLWSEFYAEADH